MDFLKYLLWLFLTLAAIFLPMILLPAVFAFLVDLIFPGLEWLMKAVFYVMVTIGGFIGFGLAFRVGELPLFDGLWDDIDPDWFD
ncbi:MAG: hypothetical protein ACI4UJ_06670 [Candidatus Cryptobacteroides sp.]